MAGKRESANDQLMKVMQTQEQRGLRATGGRLALLMLHSPLRFLLQPGLAELSYAGSRTGRLIRLPVMYAQAGDQVVVLASNGHLKTWWRNFRRPRAVEVTIAGHAWDGTAVVVRPGTARFHEALRLYLNRFQRMHYRPGDRLVAITLHPWGRAEASHAQ